MSKGIGVAMFTAPLWSGASVRNLESWLELCYTAFLLGIVTRTFAVVIELDIFS